LLFNVIYKKSNPKTVAAQGFPGSPAPFNDAPAPFNDAPAPFNDVSEC
jgi:hypothetical protein